jgi:hypothetical protein
LKVIVCTPVGGRISPLFFESWTLLVSWMEKKEGREFADFKWTYFNGSDVYVARNHLIRNPCKVSPRDISKIVPWAGVHEDYDKVLWIDSDTVFTVEDVKRILSHDADMVSGCVKVDQMNFGIQVTNPTPYGSTTFATIKDRVRDPKTGEVVEVFEKWVAENKKENDLCPIDLCGSAFLAIRKGVYEKVGYPWYRTTLADFNGVKVEMGEDIGFTYRATQAGFKLWADPEVRPGHEKALEIR